MRIGLDVDDVVLDLLTPWLNAYNRKHEDANWTPEDLTQWEIWHDIGCSKEEMYALLTPDLYDNAQPIPGALEAAKAIRELGHDIVYVTTCPNTDHGLAKLDWLERHGFFESNDKMYSVGPWATHTSKSTVPVEWLVDDNVKNVEDFPGHALLVTKPHNRRIQCTRKRVKNLSDVVRELEFCKAPMLQATVYVPSTKPSNPKDIIGSDKLPLHLWPETATVHGSLAMLDGALKYGRNNFRAIGVRATVYTDAAKRHLNAWLEGEEYPPDSDCHHLGHALACIAIIIDAMEAGKLNDDRQVRGGYNEMVQRLTPLVKKIKDRHADKAPKHYMIADKVTDG